MPEVGLLQDIQAQIRKIASTDQLEGFSLSQTFSETFKHTIPVRRKSTPWWARR